MNRSFVADISVHQQRILFHVALTLLWIFLSVKLLKVVAFIVFYTPTQWKSFYILVIVGFSTRSAWYLASSIKAPSVRFHCVNTKRLVGVLTSDEYVKWSVKWSGHEAEDWCYQQQMLWIDIIEMHACIQTDRQTDVHIQYYIFIKYPHITRALIGGKRCLYQSI